MNSNIKNIKPEHFKYALLPNIQNNDILNIFLFYRENIWIETNEFYNFLDDLDLTNMIYNLFDIITPINANTCPYLNELQWNIIRYDYNKLSQEEQRDLKWLLYDCTNINKKNRFLSGSNKLYVYFTDISFKRTLQKALKSHTLGFYKNESNSIPYLKLIATNSKEKIKYKSFHKFVITRGKYEQYTKVNNEIIDHIQKAPLYFYDFNYWSNITNVRYTKNSKAKYTSSEYKEYVKNLIYCKIIEKWKSKNQMVIDYKRPQFNNCYYNLIGLDKTINENIKAKIIDNSNIIYPQTYRNRKNLLYMNFFFPKSQKFKTSKGFENIVILSIIYNLEKITYTEIIKEIYNNIFNSNTSDNYDKNINYAKLFDYIKGKDIMYVIEDSNNINQKATLYTKDIFYRNNKFIEIKHYQ